MSRTITLGFGVLGSSFLVALSTPFIHALLALFIDEQYLTLLRYGMFILLAFLCAYLLRTVRRDYNVLQELLHGTTAKTALSKVLEGVLLTLAVVLALAIFTISIVS